MNHWHGSSQVRATAGAKAAGEIKNTANRTPEVREFPSSPHIRSSDSLSRFARLLESAGEYCKKLPLTNAEELLGSRWSQRTRSTACESSPGGTLSTPGKEGSATKLKKTSENSLIRSRSTVREVHKSRKNRDQAVRTCSPLFSSHHSQGRLFRVSFRITPHPHIPSTARQFTLERHRETVIREYFPGVTVPKPAAPCRVQCENDTLRLQFVGAGHRNSVTGVETTAGGMVTVGADYSAARWKLPQKPSDPYTIRTLAIGAVIYPVSVSRIHTSAVNAIRRISETRYCTAGNDSVVKVWKAQKQVAVMRVSPDCALSLATNSESLVAGTRHGSVRRWDIATLQESAQTETEHRAAVTALQIYTPQTYITASVDRCVKLWDIRSARSIVTFAGHCTPVTAVLPDLQNGFFSAAEDGVIWQWDVRNNAVHRELRQGEPVTALTLMRGRLVSSGTGIHVWLAGSTEAKTTFFHKGSIRAIRYFEQEDMLASVSWDRSLAVWTII